MLIVMRHGANEEQIQNVIDTIKKKGRDAHVSKGDMQQ